MTVKPHKSPLTPLLPIHLDIHMLLNSEIPVTVLRQLFISICMKQGEPINLSELGREVRLSVPTIKSLLQAFEGLFLIRRHGKCIFSEDVGMWNAFCPLKTIPGIMKLKTLVFAELKTQLGYRKDSFQSLDEYRSKSGSTIPFVVSIKGKKDVLITLDNLEYPSKQSMIALQWAAKKWNSECILVALHRGNSAAILSQKILSIPYFWIY